MSTAKELHGRAMDLLEVVILERSQGNEKLTAQRYSEALEMELAAIEELEKQCDTSEPTWLVLHRSAGWMAFNSNQFRQAEQLASKALAGEPHLELRWNFGSSSNRSLSTYLVGERTRPRGYQPGFSRRLLILVRAVASFMGYTVAFQAKCVHIGSWAGR